MAKKSKKIISDPDTGEVFDSTHELHFYWYLQELKDKGYINDFKRSKTYLLCDDVKVDYNDCRKNKKGKIVSKSFMRSISYTPDFVIFWNDKSDGIFFEFYSQLGIVDINFINIYFKVLFTDRMKEIPISVIDVKNPFNKGNVRTLFMIKQKWLFHEYGIYVQEIETQKLFAQTFMPERFKLTDSGRSSRTISFLTRDFDEYLKIRKHLNIHGTTN